MDRPTSVYAIDVDNDSDMDVLSAEYYGNTIAWYENNGVQSFTKHIIGSAGGAESVFAIDLDGDDDIDVLSAAMGLPLFLNREGDAGNEESGIIKLMSDSNDLDLPESDRPRESFTEQQIYVVPKISKELEILLNH